MLIKVICLLMGGKFSSLKLTIKMLTFQVIFGLGRISDGVSNIESREVSLNGNVHDFSVDFNYIDKSDIIRIRKYFMTKNNIK